MDDGGTKLAKSVYRMQYWWMQCNICCSPTIEIEFFFLAVFENFVFKACVFKQVSQKL